MDPMGYSCCIVSNFWEAPINHLSASPSGGSLPGEWGWRQCWSTVVEGKSGQIVINSKLRTLNAIFILPTQPFLKTGSPSPQFKHIKMATNRDNFKVCPCLFVKFCQQQRPWFRSHPGSPNLNTHAFRSQVMEIDKLVQCVLVPNRLLQYVLFITCLLFYIIFLLLPSGLYRAFMLQWKNACPRLPRPCLPGRCHHGAERRPGGRTRRGRSAVSASSASSAGGSAVCRGWGGVLHHFNVQKHQVEERLTLVIFTKNRYEDRI